MQDSFDVHGSAGPDPATLLDFERLDVYRVALEFQALAPPSRCPRAAAGFAISSSVPRSRSFGGLRFEERGASAVDADA
jgi:hypothetical protein